VVSLHQRFSMCYDEKVDMETVCEDAVKHLLLHVTQGGRVHDTQPDWVCQDLHHHRDLHVLSDDLFTETVGNVDFAVSVSAVEIAGTKCFDLIRDSAKVLECDDGEGNTN
jgi:hypothetical protein